MSQASSTSETVEEGDLTYTSNIQWHKNKNKENMFETCANHVKTSTSWTYVLKLWLIAWVTRFWKTKISTKWASSNWVYLGCMPPKIRKKIRLRFPHLNLPRIDFFLLHVRITELQRWICGTSKPKPKRMAWKRRLLLDTGPIWDFRGISCSSDLSALMFLKDF